jgi:hypothetical protein
VTRVGAPPTVDLARITKGGVWHFVDEHVADGELGPVVNIVCGGTRDAIELEFELDATRHPAPGRRRL